MGTCGFSKIFHLGIQGMFQAVSGLFAYALGPQGLNLGTFLTFTGKLLCLYLQLSCVVCEARSAQRDTSDFTFGDTPSEKSYTTYYVTFLFTGCVTIIIVISYTTSV